MFLRFCKALAVLFLTLTTVTGGLLLIRRFKHALWLGGMLLTASVIDLAVYKLAMRTLQSDLTALEVYPWLLYLHIAYLPVVGALTIASVSCVLSLDQSAIPVPTRMRFATLTVSGLALIATYWAMPLASDHVRIVLRQDGIPFAYPPTEDDSESVAFRKSLLFKDPNQWGEVSFPIIFGSGEIRGYVTYNGEPADVSIRLFVGDWWRTTTTRTGPSGEFTLQVPRGRFEINRIDLEWWFNKPADGRDYMPILIAPFTPFAWAPFDEAEYVQRIQIDALDGSGSPELELRIVDFIETEWPIWGETGQIGVPNQDEIRWSRVLTAVCYDITIGKYDDKGRGSRHLRIRSQDTTIPLTSLPLSRSDELHEFYLVIHAYDAQNRFIGASKSAFGSMSFSIAAHTIEGDLPRPCDQ